MGSPSTEVRAVNVARSAAQVLDEHTTLELECIDRMYLNVYVPVLQTGAGASYFFRRQSLRHDHPDLLRRRNTWRRPDPFRLAESVPVGHLVTVILDMEEDDHGANDAQSTLGLAGRCCRTGAVQAAVVADEQVISGVGIFGVAHQDPLLIRERETQCPLAGHVMLCVMRYKKRMPWRAQLQLFQLNPRCSCRKMR